MELTQPTSTQLPMISLDNEVAFPGAYDGVLAPESLSDRIEPTTRAFLHALARENAPDVHEQSVEEARLGMTKSQSVYSTKLPANIEDHVLPCGPSGEVSVRVVRPPDHELPLPVVMYFHGGGWVLGDKAAYDRVLREIAHGADAAVVFVNFTRSPEVRYPVAVEEVYAATEWIAKNGRSLNLDSSRLAVVGDSAGGNLATVTALLAKERGGPAIASQILLYPTTDSGFDTDSYDQFADGHFLTRETMKWFWNHYAPDVSMRAEPTASPLRASLEQLSGLPSSLVLTAEFDVLRDEGEAYARKLTEAGVRVIAVRYLGTIHAFTVLNALADTPAAHGAIAQVNSELRRSFGNLKHGPRVEASLT